MGVRESWNELGTGGKVAVGLLVGGVVLVVGIVLLVILAAVVGSFVLGAGSSAGGAAAVPPTTSMAVAFDEGAGTATVTHESGDEIAADSLRLRVDGELVEWTDADGTVSPGDSTTVDASAGTTVRVVWSGGEDLVTLASDTVGE